MLKSTQCVLSVLTNIYLRLMKCHLPLYSEFMIQWLWWVCQIRKRRKPRTHGPWEAEKTQQLVAQVLLCPFPSRIKPGPQGGRKACPASSAASDGSLGIPNRVVVSQRESWFPKDGASFLASLKAGHCPGVSTKQVLSKGEKETTIYWALQVPGMEPGQVCHVTLTTAL